MKRLLSAMVLGTALLITSVPVTKAYFPNNPTIELSATRPVYPPVIFID